MADDNTRIQSRRALLAAAAGGAAALAATAAMPLTALAADPNDLVLGAVNHAGDSTVLISDVDGDLAFSVASTGAGVAVEALSGGGIALKATSGSVAGVYATSVSSADAAPVGATPYTGVYGWSPSGEASDIVGAGVWGDSDDWGVYGTGAVGVYGWGAYGVIGESASTATPGVWAIGANITSPALEVYGKVKFSRSGRKLIGAGKSSVNIALPGTTTSSKIFAVLATNRSGRYVRAVVPASGQFSIYLNTTVTSNSYISWFVLD